MRCQASLLLLPTLLAVWFNIVEPTKEMVLNVMRGTGMDYIQARNHLKCREAIREMNKITSGIQQQQAADDAARIAQAAIAKAMRS